MAATNGGQILFDEYWSNYYGTAGGDGSITIAYGADDDAAVEAEEEERSRPLWHLSIVRKSAEAGCPDGYSASWDYWPNGGNGGYVCNRVVFGDEPLR